MTMKGLLGEVVVEKITDSAKVVAEEVSTFRVDAPLRYGLR
jgi:hypothetical protein